MLGVDGRAYQEKDARALEKDGQAYEEKEEYYISRFRFLVSQGGIGAGVADPDLGHRSSEWQKALIIEINCYARPILYRNLVIF